MIAGSRDEGSVPVCPVPVCHLGSDKYAVTASVAMKVVEVVLQTRLQSWVLARLCGLFGRSHRILQECGVLGMEGGGKRIDRHSGCSEPIEEKGVHWR